MKKTLATIAIVGGIATGAVVLQPDNTIPTFSFVIDEPISQPENIRAQLDLIEGGGVYKGRKINVILTERTHPDNVAVLSEFNVEIIKRTNKLSASERKEIFSEKTR